MAGRRLSAEERALWSRVMATVTPMAGSRAATPALPREADQPIDPANPKRVKPLITTRSVRDQPSPKTRQPGTTLDGSWDRRLSRGLQQPDATVDLHGHTLNSAWSMLDSALEQSIARGDRVILLVTGKPPRPQSERPHARGAIRAAIGDWLHASRHASSIAAVRGASPRHGGAGALYIVLRKPRAERIF